MSSEDCQKYLKSIGKEFYTGGLGCNGTFDTLLCWEATPANTTLKQKCPSLDLIFDTSKFVYKHCTTGGYWENSGVNGDHNVTLMSGGKTDYMTYCLSDSAKVFGDYGDISVTILRINRYIELIGLCLSFICICLSLFIFLYFKVLKCNRTRIHIHLFAAILVQIILRLIIYVDELAEKSDAKEIGVVSTIAKHTKGLCQILYILLHYSLSSMFMWMLVEGVYLNILLMNSLFDENKHKIMLWFSVLAWGLPIIFVLIWAFVMVNKLGINERCWIGFDKMKYYWILQGPRFIIMTINVLCLFNVIRILVTKLRENRTTETQQIRKSLKAAFLLLPLLGIAHVVNFFDPPKHPVVYTIYTIGSSVFIMYQGFFVSLLYCFLNNEVKTVLKRFWKYKIRFEREIFKNNRHYPSLATTGSEKLEKEKFIIVEEQERQKQNCC